MIALKGLHFALKNAIKIGDMNEKKNQPKAGAAYPWLTTDETGVTTFDAP